MSLHPQPWPEPSGEITRAVLAIYAGKRAPLPIVVRLAYLGITNAFALLRLLPGSDRDKDVEILALRPSR